MYIFIPCASQLYPYYIIIFTIKAFFKSWLLVAVNSILLYMIYVYVNH